MRRCVAVLAVLMVVGPAWAADTAKGFKAGVATRVITPKEPLWMAGYASRNKPCAEKLQDLFVKALAFEDADGQRFVLLTTDLIGLSREVSAAVRYLLEVHGAEPMRAWMTARGVEAPAFTDSLVESDRNKAEQVVVEALGETHVGRYAGIRDGTIWRSWSTPDALDVSGYDMLLPLKDLKVPDADPPATLRRLFRFLGVDPDAPLAPMDAERHVIGNGMRLDGAREVRADERWREALGPAELAAFEAEAGALNRRYGYGGGAS